MNDETPLSHDQIIARTQAFYEHLRTFFDESKIEFNKIMSDDSELDKELARQRYETASELLDLYTHTFESVVYTWIH